jgi:hypothetical protein
MLSHALHCFMTWIHRELLHTCSLQQQSIVRTQRQDTAATTMNSSHPDLDLHMAPAPALATSAWCPAPQCLHCQGTTAVTPTTVSLHDLPLEYAMPCHGMAMSRPARAPAASAAVVHSHQLISQHHARHSACKCCAQCIWPCSRHHLSTHLISSL